MRVAQNLFGNVSRVAKSQFIVSSAVMGWQSENCAMQGEAILRLGLKMCFLLWSDWLVWWFFSFVMPGRLQAEQSHTKITQKVTQSTKGLDFNIKGRFKKQKKQKKNNQCVHDGLPGGDISSLETLVVFQIISFHLCNSLSLLISTRVALPPMTLLFCAY